MKRRQSITHLKSGHTLVEILVTGLILLAALSGAMYVLIGSHKTDIKLTAAANLDDGWQRFVQLLRADLRSAHSVAVEKDQLRVQYARFVQNKIDLHEVLYYLGNDGNLVRQQAGADEKNIALFSSNSLLKGNLWFKMNASESVSVKIEIYAANSDKSIFTKEELITIASAKQ